MSSSSRIVCQCSEVILKSVDGELKIRSKMMVVRGNTVLAVCKSCSSEIPVPQLSLTETVVERTGPPLILRK